MRLPRRIPAKSIEQKIYLLRGQRVMIGPDLASLYGVETRALMQAVRRNRDRFPPDFIFDLSREEIQRISQSVISLRYAKSVAAFTEQGVAMISGILHSKRAVVVNIAIMRTFVKLRLLLSAHAELSVRLRELEHAVGSHNRAIRSIFQTLKALMAPPVRPARKIGFGIEPTEVDSPIK